ncbi:MAG: LemA-like protein [candidate division CPR2 bacterium GW2011_GWC1_39_9]|uniref:LemA-like protein n=1 Tax=candidate division CPR2 bacterium GW2011_GWC2_39_10 TaxID=1618345 RepID=A0A0G0LVK8_UNCC2|nr:MAG: LemA-like protein [candidate division CPR2 bacterium GW2011_GWC2_39_10]KKR35646.1 MAG: LemA-like protein [candidate division CPR2 bacterium GW2011_GWC1_39_9]
MIVIYVSLGLIILVALYFGMTYNRFVTLRTRAQEAWSDIDVQLKRRHDLIPNLVETVKGYATHEKTVFEDVTKARASALNAGGVVAQGKAENMLTEALKSIFAVAEAYPDLKASDNFQKLQDELTDTEDKVQASRRFYNGNVRDLNIKVDQFPSNIVAKSFKFQKMELFEVDSPEEKENVEVKF